MKLIKDFLMNDAIISFIGGGNMAQALISGLIAKGVKPSHITVSDPSDAIRQQLSSQNIKTVNPLGGTDSDNLKVAVKNADVVILAVKPQVMRQVVSGFKDVLDRQLVISIAAGLSTDTLQTMLSGYAHIIRAMPNTPAMMQEGATGLYATELINNDQKALAAEIMSAVGLVIWVDDEAQLHAVTAISGSAPAYFFYMLESMTDAGVKLGLEEKKSAALAMQTALGAAKMSICSNESPAMLRRKVTSPNGTTQAAIESLQANNFCGIIEQAMQACYQRSETLSIELGHKNDD